MKDIAKLGMYLLFVCSVSGISLAVTNHFTAPRIASEMERRKNEAMSDVLPAASKFVKSKTHEKVFEGFNYAGVRVGYVFETLASGYSSDIAILFAIDNEYIVTGVKVLSQSETPGLGSKVSGDEFLKQFKGKSREKIMLKKAGGDIDAVTSATISSKAVTEAVRSRIYEFQKDTK